MSNINLEKLDIFQVKTTLKGIYLVFSFMLFLFIGKTMSFLPNSFEEIFISVNIIEFLGILLILSTLSSLFSAFLYYTRIENFVTSTWFNLRYSKKFKDYKSVSLKNSFNHPYIKEEKNEIYSTIYLILILYLFNISYFWLLPINWVMWIVLGSFIITSVILVLYNKLYYKRKIKNREILFYSFYMPFLILLIFNSIFNLVSLFFFFLILILFVKSKYTWISIRKRIIYVYYKNLIIQKLESLNDPIRSSSTKEFHLIKEFIESVNKRLWTEVDINFNNLLEHIQNDISNNVKLKFDALTYFLSEILSLTRRDIFEFIDVLRNSYYGNNKVDWEINYSSDKHKIIARNTFRFEFELNKLLNFFERLFTNEYYFYVFIIFSRYSYKELDRKIDNLKLLGKKGSAKAEEWIEKLNNTLQHINPTAGEKRKELILDHLEGFLESYKNELSYLILHLLSKDGSNDNYFSLNELKSHLTNLELRINALLSHAIF